MDATTAGARNGAVGDEDDAQTCLYCANLNVLRDLLPPKRCDYVRPLALTSACSVLVLLWAANADLVCCYCVPLFSAASGDANSVRSSFRCWACVKGSPKGSKETRASASSASARSARKMRQPCPVPPGTCMGMQNMQTMPPCQIPKRMSASRAV